MNIFTKLVCVCARVKAGEKTTRMYMSRYHGNLPDFLSRYVIAAAVVSPNGRGGVFKVHLYISSLKFQFSGDNDTIFGFRIGPYGLWKASMRVGEVDAWVISLTSGFSVYYFLG